MNPIYRKLMEQHGGSIPFEILGGVQTKLRKKGKKTRRRSSRVHKRRGRKRSERKL